MCGRRAGVGDRLSFPPRLVDVNPKKMETSLQRISYVFIQYVHARFYVRFPRGPGCPRLDTHYLLTLYFIALGSSEIVPLEQHGCILRKISCRKCGCKRNGAEPRDPGVALQPPVTGQNLTRVIRQRTGEAPPTTRGCVHAHGD